ncbi:MAG: carbohydrate-binding domain-containing protein [Oscillospiraceae bacterium]|nr:carbohydrate-binding domain-containing protein [Oscillospiraceae bacterium]
MKKYLAIILAAAAIAALVAVALLRNGSAGADGVRVFTFRDDGVSFSGGSTNYEISGTQVTITGSGVFTLTGACAEGSVVVKKGVTDVTLILRDLELSASDTAPIVLKKNSQVELRIEGDCTLTDNEDPENENEDTFEGAAIKVKTGASLTLTGDGTLYLAGNAKNAIKGAAEASVTVDGPTVTVAAVKDGVACDGEITILSGALDVTAGNDGVKASPDDGDDASLGNVTILGGTLRLAVGDDAIHAAGVLTVGTEGAEEGPQITVTESREGLEGATVLLHGGSGVICAADDAVNAGGSGENAIRVTGGSWYVDSDGDGFDANGGIEITGGSLEIYGAENGSGANTALDSDTGVAVTGGSVLTVDTNGTQPEGVRVRFTGLSLQSGSALEIRDASGTVLRTGTAQKSASTVLLAGDGVAEGETYTLFVDGAAAATATAEQGEYTDEMFGGFGGPMTPPDFANGERPERPAFGKSAETSG